MRLIQFGTISLIQIAIKEVPVEAKKKPVVSVPIHIRKNGKLPVGKQITRELIRLRSRGALKPGDMIRAVHGDVENGLVFCGSNVGKIDRISTVREVIEDLMYEKEVKMP